MKHEESRCRVICGATTKTRSELGVEKKDLEGRFWGGEKIWNLGRNGRMKKKTIERSTPPFGFPYYDTFLFIQV